MTCMYPILKREYTMYIQNGILANYLLNSALYTAYYLLKIGSETANIKKIIHRNRMLQCHTTTKWHQYRNCQNMDNFWFCIQGAWSNMI